MEFRKIKANEIDLRVGSITTKGYTLLLYKDARCDMNILDECVGAMNWQREHKELKGNIYCGVSIWDETKQQWITKWDCGAESFTEKEKGEASDSFKRACFNVGIGRELYTAPFIWINCECLDKKLPYEEQKRINGMRVSKIEYDNNAIVSLEIVDNKGNQVFVYGSQEKPNKEPKIALSEKKPSKPLPPRIANYTKDAICVKEIDDDEKALDMLNASLPNEQWDAINETGLNLINWAKNKGKRICDLTLKDVKNAIIDKKIALSRE